MNLPISTAVLLFTLTLSSTVLAQDSLTFSGQVQDWQYGEAQLIIPGSVPPPLSRPEGAPVIGAVAADGSFTFTLPETMPEEDFVPVGEFLDPGCTDLTVSPEDASYYPVAIVAYRSDGSVIGEIFRGSPGIEAGPIPPGYSVLSGYATESFTVRGSCPAPDRAVVEDYDFAVEPGWHDVIQRFMEAPERPNWRIDRWVSEPIPDDAVWVLIRPPQ